MLVRTLYYIYIFETHTLVFLVAQTCSKPAPFSQSGASDLSRSSCILSGMDALMQLQFNIARHVMMAQEEVELHQHHVMTHGSHWSFWSFWCSDVSGFHVFHVALKFQYLHTSALPPCTFALATLKTPGGGDPGIKATRGDNGGLTMHI